MATPVIELFKIKAVTNLHVGSGGTNYGIIDNTVQRDPTTGYPIIHSSSLKGALREYCAQNDFNETALDYIFGSNRKEDPGKTSPGNYKFFSAHLLSVPVRSNKLPYFNGTSPQVVNDFISFCDNSRAGLHEERKSAMNEFAHLLDGPLVFDGHAPAMLEGKNGKEGALQTSKLDIVKSILGENPALFQNPEFDELIMGLPVIARNQLENGISQNLWYEEVVPRQTLFYFGVMHDGEYFDIFEKKITQRMVQIGANASVGYGFCEISKMELL